MCQKCFLQCMDVRICWRKIYLILKQQNHCSGILLILFLYACYFCSLSIMFAVDLDRRSSPRWEPMGSDSSGEDKLRRALPTAGLGPRRFCDRGWDPWDHGQEWSAQHHAGARVVRFLVITSGLCLAWAEVCVCMHVRTLVSPWYDLHGWLGVKNQ